MSCPFYGRALFLPQAPGGFPFILVQQSGNQCALKTSRYAPCYMELESEQPDWQKCVIVRDIRMEVPADAE